VEKERRRSARYRIHGSLSFGGDYMRGGGQIYNVSATGCAVGSPCDVSLGSRLCVSLQLVEIDPVIIDTAIVRWVYQYKFGVEFLLADAAEVSRLGACLEGLQQTDRGES
jgi:hypothetical protein